MWWLNASHIFCYLEHKILIYLFLVFLLIFNNRTSKGNNFTKPCINRFTQINRFGVTHARWASDFLISIILANPFLSFCAREQIRYTRVSAICRTWSWVVFAALRLNEIWTTRGISPLFCEASAHVLFSEHMVISVRSLFGAAEKHWLNKEVFNYVSFSNIN